MRKSPGKRESNFGIRPGFAQRVIEIQPGLFLNTKSDLLVINVGHETADLDLVKVVTLRNALSNWANKKRERDREKEQRESSRAQDNDLGTEERGHTDRV